MIDWVSSTLLFIVIFPYIHVQVCNPTRDLVCSDEVREVNERVCNVVETEECKDVEETECEPTFKEECFTAPSTRCNEVTRRLCETEERYCISITEFCLTGKVTD